MATPPSSGGTNIAMPTRLWATNSPAILPQITLAVEDYNRLVRMIQCGEKPVMAVDLRVQYQTEDLMAYNTVAEIPGTDLKDEVVMVGGHLDSWHIGTGATDNAVGVTAAMEAVRIIKALDLKPRRTIRIGLWSGEEQGLLGSKAYVSQHFGSLTNRAISERIAAPKDESDEESSQPRRQERVRRTRVVKQKEYDKLSAYFNLDNGAGKIRGIHLQGNEALRPIFREWLQPFSDLGASTISASNTGGTDHTSFDAIGLPGFQFIQDPLEYWSRTHHANQDVLERIVPDDLKQAATILAAFAYQAAMEEERLPRKPAP
jgi:Zn-dependent M28 family amino/carboxypeptidase